MLCNTAKQDHSLTTIAALRRSKHVLTFGSALLTVRLHCNVRIQMIQCAIGLFTSLPTAFVHAFYFLIPTPGALVLLSTGNRHK